jgi:ankyrin repeat protein
MSNLSEHEENSLSLKSAIQKGDLLEVKRLINAGVDINEPFSGIGVELPLGIAIAFGQVEIVETLLLAGAYPHGYMLLHIDLNTSAKTLEIVSLLIYAGIELNFPMEEEDTVLMKAAGEGRLDLVKLLVQEGANVNQTNKYGESALMYATYHPWLQVYEYLAPLTNAELRRETEETLPSRIIFRQRKDDLFTENFIMAARSGNIEVILESIKNGVNINAYSSQGNTALHEASEHSNLSVVRILLELGADINIKTESSKDTPLILAASRLIRLRYIGNYRIDTKLKLDNEFESEAIQVVSFLIKSGADVNTKNKNGWTALMGTANAGSIEGTKILIKAGADINAKDKYGRNPLSLAKEKGNTEIIQLL